MKLALLRETTLLATVVAALFCAQAIQAQEDAASPAASATVTLTLKAPLPAALATRTTATGSFTKVTPKAGTISFSATGDYSVAWVCPPFTLTEGGIKLSDTYQHLVDANIKDFTAIPISCNATLTLPKTAPLIFDVDAAAITAANQTELQATSTTATEETIKNSTAVWTSSSAKPFEVPIGSDRVDVLAYKYNSTTYAEYLEAVRSYTGQTVVATTGGKLNGGAQVSLAAADKTTVEPLSVTGTPAGFSAPTTMVMYVPKNASTAIMTAIGATTSYPALPAAMWHAGDMYTLMSMTEKSTITAAGSLTSSVNVMKFLTSAGPVSIALPKAWSYAGPAAAATPTFTYSYTGFTGTLPVYRRASINWAPTLTNPYTNNYYDLVVSQHWNSGTATVPLVNLSSLSGFLKPPVLSATNPAVTMYWTASIMQSALGPYTAPTAAALEVSVSNDSSYMLMY